MKSYYKFIFCIGFIIFCVFASKSIWFNLLFLDKLKADKFFPEAEYYCITGAYNLFKADNKIISQEAESELKKLMAINSDVHMYDVPSWMVGIKNNKVVFLINKSSIRYAFNNHASCISKSGYIIRQKMGIIPKISFSEEEKND